MPERKPQPSVRTLADFHCDENAQTGEYKCRQVREPSPEIRGVLNDELHRLGMATAHDKEVRFRAWESGDWILALGLYSRTVKTELTWCQVIAVIDRDKQVHVVRQQRCTKTDADVPQLTTYDFVDVPDLDGDGRPEIILRADAYEDHWFEVVSVGQDWKFTTIFQGLGYYL